jgi:hypothetical protein
MYKLLYALLLFTCHPLFAQTQLRVKVNSGGDDVEVSTQIYAESSDLELGGFDTENLGKQYVAIRFQGVNLPANAQISRAYIQFTTKDVKILTASVQIKCQRGNAAAYNPTENLQLRSYVTTNPVSWNPPAWTVANESGLNQRTSDLSGQIASAISTGWASGNALSFILEGNATQSNILNARSYENNATHAGAPELVIEYTTPTGGGSTTIRNKVITGSDDVELTTQLYTESSDLEIGGFDGSNGGKQTIAIRFQNVAIPANAQVSRAYIQFTSKATNTATASVTIRCQRGNAAPYASLADINGRTYVPSTVNWNPPAWTVANVTGVNQQTANLASLVSAAISTGWQSGNALSFTLAGSATSNDILNARSFENNDTRDGIPELVIEYTTGSNPCSPDVVRPTLNNCPTNRTVTTLGTTAVTTWTAPTVSDNCTENITPSVSSAPTTGLVSSSAFPVGVTTVTYTARDAANNVSSCSFTVTVQNNNPCNTDATPPVFANCPTNISLSTSGTTATATWTAPTVSDNCTAGIVPTITTSPTSGLTSGSAFPIGTTTVTYNARDARNNTATPCTFTVTVNAVVTGPQVFINEVAPQGTIAISEDWIELYNNATTPLNLNDIFITNKIATPFKQALTGLNIPAKGFLVLLADNLPSLGAIHLNFKVGASGETLYLHRNVNGAAVLLATFISPLSPPEEDNVTFGGLVEGQVPSSLTKFLGGTPNAANATGKTYVKVGNSLPRGILTGASNVTLTAPAGSTIRYTRDNSFPSRTNGTIYTGPINISTTTVLKTFAYSSSSESKVESYTYIFPTKGPELLFPNFVTEADFSNGMRQLPIVSVSTNVLPVESRTEKLTTFEYINKFGENASIGVTCGVEGYGNGSFESLKKNMRLSFKNQYGYGNLEYPLFPREDVDTYNPTNKLGKMDLVPKVSE